MQFLEIVGGLIGVSLLLGLMAAAALFFANFLFIGIAKLFMKPGGCPVCRSSKVLVIAAEVGENSSTYVVVCDACGAEGFPRGDPASAMRDWNSGHTHRPPA